MNGNDFLNAMTDVDEKHITAAEKKPAKRGIFIGMASAAAVIMVTAISVSQRIPGSNANMSNPSELINSIAGETNGVSGGDAMNGTSVSRVPNADIVFPTAPDREPVASNGESTNGAELPVITPWYYSTGGMGGPSGSDEPMTDAGNPWSAESNFETLPVYDNFFEYSEHDYVLQTLDSVTKTLGYDPSEMTIDDNFPTEEGEQRIREQYEGYGAPEDEIQRIIRIMKLMSGMITATIKNQIEISMNVSFPYEVIVNFDDYRHNALLIPDEYKPASLTITEMDKAGRYMLETYRNMFGIENPVLSEKASGNGKVVYYEGSSGAEEFVNYQLNSVELGFNPDGNVISIKFRANGLKKIGDYPIVSVDEATERLYNNQYLSMLGTFDHEFDGTEPIGAVELVYLYRREHEYTMPYYHFEVGLTSDQAGFEIDIGTRYFDYYVPAITDEYLGDWLSEPMGLPK